MPRLTAMLMPKLVSAVALAGALAVGSQGAVSCDPPRGGAPENRVEQGDSDEGLIYEATCGENGEVLSYRPQTAEAHQHAIRGCQVADQNADRLQAEFDKITETEG